VTPNFPKPLQIRHFLSPFVFVVGGDRDFKFGRLVDRSYGQPVYPRTTNHPLNRRGQVTWTI